MALEEWTLLHHHHDAFQSLKKGSRTRTPRLAHQTRGSKPEALPVHPWSKPHGYGCGRLGGAQVFCERLAGLAVGDDLIRDLLAFAEAAHSGPLDCADMHEDVLAAVHGLNEAEALLAVEPLYDSRIHGSISF